MLKKKKHVDCVIKQMLNAQSALKICVLFYNVSFDNGLKILKKKSSGTKQSIICLITIIIS